MRHKSVNVSITSFDNAMTKSSCLFGMKTITPIFRALSCLLKHRAKELAMNLTDTKVGITPE